VFALSIFLFGGVSMTEDRPITEQESDRILNETIHEGTLTVIFESGAVSIYSEGECLRELATQADCCINKITVSSSQEHVPYRLINYDPQKGILRLGRK